MAIQQSINQLLGTASIAAGLYAHSPAGQRKFKLKDLEGQATRAQERITKRTGEITDMSPEAFADLQKQVGEFNQITEEYAKLTPDANEALELDKLRVNINEAMNERISQRMEKEQQKQEATAAKAEEAANIKAIRDMILHGTPAEFEQPTKREVIKYGK